MTWKSRFRISKRGILFLGIALVAIVVPLTLLAVKGLEGESPTLLWDSPIQFIGPSKVLKGTALDQKSGLRRLWIAILQQGREVILLDQEFPRVLFKGEPLRRRPVSVDINVRSLGLEDGEALLRTAVWDQSFRRWWSGNRTYEEKRVTIDTQPPDVEMVSRQHNLNQGGAGLAIYRTSEPVAKSGVQVGDRFFPGSMENPSYPNVFVAFFAIPYDSSPDAQLYVMATDGAGNATRVGFTHYINRKVFAQDTLNLSETFLKKKTPEFERLLDKETASASLLEKFLAVNRAVRQANHKTVEGLCNYSDAKWHWEGPFLRLPGSARRAAFGDHRTYQYEGHDVDHQVHLGVDLASTANSPVPASNSGRVAFAANLGIYGKTIFIDHGFGLFSMYAHLSHIQVTPGQVVSKGDIIGSTGSTGLAGGDHLHFGTLIHDTFVNPVEWWDPSWIKHNVTDKLHEIAHKG
ncbi:MAG: M23 family metallopeptidase [Thermodesulfobacteriota bacterium]|nr:M23 family metallopeptidase [Thermodesulfobacteriota bacterium]